MMKLSDVTKNLEGELIADGDFTTLEYCTGLVDHSFLSFLENPKFASKISKYASCILCRREMTGNLPDTVTGIFVTEQPKEAFHQIHNALSQDVRYCLQEYESEIGEGCCISATANIAIKNVKIGNRVVIEDNVVIGDYVEIGDDTIIHSGAVIGGKAFTFARASQKRILGLNDVGSIYIGNRVEIFPMVHVAKGILPTDITLIDDDVKIDALVHVGHGARIGKRTLIAACAVIGGNTRIGEDSWVGINATVSNRITIGNRARVSLGSVVTKNVADDQIVTGNFAIEHEKFLDNLKQSIGK